MTKNFDKEEKLEISELESIIKTLKNEDGYIKISELTERFVEVDEYFNHEPWNLKQILNQIHIFIPIYFNDEH